MARAGVNDRFARLRSNIALFCDAACHKLVNLGEYLG